MSFEQLQAKVSQAEDALEARERTVAADLRVLTGSWREALTPTRIVVAGVVAGFLVGRAQPLRTGAALGGTRWLQLASSVAGLVGALQAKFAAKGAQDAATEAEDAAAEAEIAADDASAGTTADDAAERVAGPLPPSARRRRPDPAWDTRRTPAEAATDLSEQR